MGDLPVQVPCNPKAQKTHHKVREDMDRRQTVIDIIVEQGHGEDRLPSTIECEEGKPGEVYIQFCILTSRPPAPAKPKLHHPDPKE
jgi:hypothetical protein